MFVQVLLNQRQGYTTTLQVFAIVIARSRKISVGSPTPSILLPFLISMKLVTNNHVMWSIIHDYL